MPVYYLRPNADSKAGWTEDPVGTAWSVLDDDVLQPTAPTTGSDRITTTTNGAISKQELTTITLGTNETVVGATVWAYGKAAASCYWSAELFSGAVNVATATQTSASFGWVSGTYTGSFTQSEINALATTVTSVIVGGLTVEVDAVYVELRTVVAAGVSVVRPEVRLDVTNVVTTPSGKRYRWAEDDPDPALVPNGGSFSTTMPGGFESREVTLPRQSQTDYDDLERLSDLTVYGAGGEVAWEGRLESAPRVSGSQMAASPGAVGWQAHLEDDKSARMIYRDTDLGSWTGQSAERQVAIDTSTIRGDGEVVWNAAVGASLAQIQEGGWAANQGPYIESWYDAGEGALLAEIYSKWSRSYLTVSTTWDWRIGSGDEADGSDLVHSSDLQSEPSASGEATYTLATASRYGVVRTLWNSTTAAGSDNSRFGVLWHDVAVYGNHGLTKRGTEPDAGFYASDIIKHAVQTWAPLLHADDTTVSDSGYILPQAAYRDPTTAAEIVRDANRIHLWDWAVWEGRRFYYNAQGARGRTWRARTGPSQLNETGPQIDRLWNGVIVSWQDVDGTTKMVGPTGATAGATSDDLTDTDPENPANQLGIRRWDMLSLSGVSTLAAATEVGRRFLIESKQLDHSGSAQLTGIAEDDHGVRYPAYMVRAGDRISFIDASDPSPRRIVKSTYDEGTRTCSIDLDAPPQGLEALLERLGAVLVPLGVS